LLNTVFLVLFVVPHKQTVKPAFEWHQWNEASDGFWPRAARQHYRLSPFNIEGQQWEVGNFGYAALRVGYEYPVSGSPNAQFLMPGSWRSWQTPTCP